MTRDDEALAQEVLDFWWSAGEPKWYGGGSEFDDEIRGKFGALHERASAGELSHWRENAVGALALLILLDQFSRNLHRGSPKAFENDTTALEIARHSIDRGFDKAFPNPHKGFFYLPFEHCEDIGVQEEGIDLFHAAGHENGYHYALIHMDVIRRFGRFPHRNAALGRATTPAEQKFLDSGGFSA